MKTNPGFSLSRRHDEFDDDRTLQPLEAREALRIVPNRVMTPHSFLRARSPRLRLRCDDREARLLMELL